MITLTGNAKAHSDKNDTHLVVGGVVLGLGHVAPELEIDLLRSVIKLESLVVWVFMDKRSNHHLHVIEISRWRSTVPAPTPSLPFSRRPNLASSSTPSSGTSPSL